MPLGTRAEVRGALETFFNSRITSGAIPTLGAVYGFPEKFMDEQEMFSSVQPGVQDGAFLFIHLLHSFDKRDALGGPTSGKKWVQYDCVLTIVFRSLKPSSVDAGTDNEAMIDAIVVQIRANRTVDNTGTIFQWGEGTDRGGQDIEVESFYPQTLHASAQATQILTTIKVIVAQQITS